MASEGRPLGRLIDEPGGMFWVDNAGKRTQITTSDPPWYQKPEAPFFGVDRSAVPPGLAGVAPPPDVEQVWRREILGEWRMSSEPAFRLPSSVHPELVRQLDEMITANYEKFAVNAAQMKTFKVTAKEGPGILRFEEVDLDKLASTAGDIDDRVEAAARAAAAARHLTWKEAKADLARELGRVASNYCSVCVRRLLYSDRHRDGDIDVCGPCYRRKTDTQTLADRTIERRFLPGDHVSVLLSEGPEMVHQRIVLGERSMTSASWLCRLVTASGALSAPTTIPDADLYVTGTIIEPIPTHEPAPAPRGRKRLKPGVSL